MNNARYIVRVTKFKCVDESGYDRFGSDEPYWIFTSLIPGKTARTSKSKVFGDVDSGETKRFSSKDNRNTIWPKKGDTKGEVAPIVLTIQLWENDQGSPSSVAKKTEKVFSYGGKVPVYGTILSS